MLTNSASGSEVVDFFGAKKKGSWFVACCPAHADSDPSLVLKPGANDGWIVKCLAGCSFKSILEKCPDHIKNAIRGSRFTAGPKKREVCSYPYHDEHGNVLYECVRFEPKSFKPRRPHIDDPKEKWGLGGSRKVLYRLPEVRSAIQNGEAVCLCEGEKDAESLRALGLTATTNISGAGSWNREYAEQLRGAFVFIFEDQDDAGRERTQKVVKSLRGIAKSVRVARDEQLLQVKDVSDFIASLTCDAETKRSRLRDILDSAVEPIETPAEKQESKPSGASGRKHATPEDYVDFITKLPRCKDMRRDIVTDQLCVTGTDGLWVHWNEELLDYITVEASRYGKFFSLPMIPRVCEWYRLEHCKPQLLVDIPEWDGQDRMREVTNVFELNNVSNETFYQLMCQFGATVFARVKDNTVQPICPILKGEQGCGKDSFIDALFGGLNGYYGQMVLAQGKITDTLVQVSQRLVLTIPEFERTSKFEVATLRYLLNTAITDVRAPYGRGNKIRRTRASFISSANASDVLMDGTGNRRYWFFEVGYAGFTDGEPDLAYPGLWNDPERDKNRMQLLAQFRALHDSGFRASKEALSEMRQVIADKTPEDYEELVVDEYIAQVNIHCGPASERDEFGCPLYTRSEISAAVDAVAKRFDKSIVGVLRLIGAKGLRKRTMHGMLYRARRSGF